MKRLVLVTGANGFVGRAVVDRLAEGNSLPLAAVRQPGQWQGPGRAVTYDLLSTTLPDLSGVDAVIHCAARVHVMADSVADPLHAYREANRDATVRLAAHAAASGVRQFVFISTIKVNGERTLGRSPFTSLDEPAPVDPYGQAKLEAEQGLLELAARTGLQVTIIRPPLVYGPGVKANFRAMMKALDRGVPLPFGALHNRRSMVGVHNLADLAVHCLDVPAAQGVFLVRDWEQPTTAQTMAALARALGNKPRLVNMPVGWLRWAGRALGKQAVVSRLCDPLEVCLDHTAAHLGWQPPLSLEEGLRLTAEAYHKERL